MSVKKTMKRCKFLSYINLDHEWINKRPIPKAFVICTKKCWTLKQYNVTDVLM